MQQWFLPLGLCAAIALAVLYPGPGQALNQSGLVIGLVPLIFLINGYQTRLTRLSFGRGPLVAFGVGALISLIISPWIGLASATLLGLPASIALGLVVMSTMPPTLSSGVVLTEVAGGHVLMAMLLTISLNLVGIFTIPFMLDATLSIGADLQISPWPLLQRLLLIVLLPFLFGLGMRYLIGRSAPAWAKYVPSSCIILTVWMSMSDSRDTLLQLSLPDLLLVCLAALSVHAVLLALCVLSGRGLKLRNDEATAMLFVVSQKTLPVAIGVLTALSLPIAAALVVCIVFHFLQLMLDSVLAARLKARSIAAT